MSRLARFAAGVLGGLAVLLGAMWLAGAVTTAYGAPVGQTVRTGVARVGTCGPHWPDLGLIDACEATVAWADGTTGTAAVLTRDELTGTVPVTERRHTCAGRGTPTCQWEVRPDGATGPALGWLRFAAFVPGLAGGYLTTITILKGRKRAS